MTGEEKKRLLTEIEKQYKWLMTKSPTIYMMDIAFDAIRKAVRDEASKEQQEPRWIPVTEGLPETDNENSINNYNVMLWVKNKSHPEEEPQIYLGKLRHIDGDDGSGNFWGIETKPCDWTIWGWSYFNEPEVIAWMPLPKPYKME